MTRLSICLSLMLTGALPGIAQDPEPRPDLLRFLNGDRLHGTFMGLGVGHSAVWKAEGAKENSEYSADKLRQVVLRTGRPVRAADSLSHVQLVNGDRVPGRIAGYDGEFLVVETSYAGTLKIPRPHVSMLAPSPLGGRVLYHGPFEGDAWKSTAPPGAAPAPARVRVAEVVPAEGAADQAPDAAPSPPVEESADEEVEEPAPGWDLAGAAWYWHGKNGGTVLSRPSDMVDRSILRFELAWQNRLSFAVGFHVDFQQPNPEDLKPAEEPARNQIRRVNFNPGDVGGFPRMFGTGYVLHMQQHNQVLFRTGFDERGQPLVERIQPAASNLPFAESGTAIVELRCNRNTGNISLLINGEFAAQWAEGGFGDGYAGKGNGFGFMVAADNSPVRISDIILGEWNGMPDSARSLQTDDHDIVLLTNGTDRFSGKVSALVDGKFTLAGRYGEFRFPVEEVAEIRFARNSLSGDEPTPDDGMGIRLYPLGRISGKPLGGDASSIRLASSLMGEVTVDLDSAVILEFQPTDSFLDDWDPKF
jgi:hypothetical protein